MEDEKDGDTERFSTKVLPLSSDNIPAYGAGKCVPVTKISIK